ncbi:MAG TPA: hypothetical protein VGZ90_05845 [Puia sp.]|nr:hypothetical protein [Puia sp.]
MNLNPKYIATISLFGWVTLSLNSCIKENLPRCSGHCSNITLAGIIIDKTTNLPLPNITFDANLNLNGFCILFCTTYKVGSCKSGYDGRFTLNADIDSTLMQNFHLVAGASIPNNYLLYPELVAPGIQQNLVSQSSVEFFNLDSPEMKNMIFGFYPKTLLKMNLHRTTPIQPQNPSVELEIGFDNKTQGAVWGFDQTDFNKDTTLSIYTSGNIFTSIIVQKFTTSTNVIAVTDSIKCSLRVNNSIDIYY